MDKKRGIAVLSLMLSLAALSAQASAADQGSPSGWKLAWSDEFDGSSIDRSNWTYDLGASGWGNAEMECYTDRPENSRIEDGCLVVEARKEYYQGSKYTSARLKSQGLRSFTYGRIEARIKVPAGQGLWPAFWMLGESITTKSWPGCGEIDVMEYIGKEPEHVFGTAHGPGYSGSAGRGGHTSVDSGVASDFHVFAVEWGADEIRWFCDGDEYFKLSKADLGSKTWVFDSPSFVILNLAVGGYWPGYPDGSTAFPARMLVDYVRVYAKDSH
jgi:Beta-glucanase/Beta-glucan synthetase